MTSRYDTTGDQGAFEPGSGDLVLRNKLGVIDADEMDEIELHLLEQLYQAVLVEDFPDRTLHITDLKTWHQMWLGNVYGWAGEERSVNMAKGDFHFAAATQISRLLAVFERDCLARLTPCHDMDYATLVEAIATTHVEFILIHPFREGNGRLSRLLSDVMAVQAGNEPLDFSTWDADKSAYFSAIHAGLAGDYGPMQRLVEQALSG